MCLLFQYGCQLHKEYNPNCLGFADNDLPCMVCRLSVSKLHIGLFRLECPNCACSSHLNCSTSHPMIVVG